MKIERALISVSDKSGLDSFAKKLHSAGIEIISTGGTARFLQQAGIPTVEISTFTNHPEILDGRVKTLHPKVHGALLYLRENPSHLAQAQKQGIPPIDLVVVNLYPFSQTICQPNVTLDQAIEQIDIGGPALLRSAAKNYRYVTVVSDPADYDAVASEILEKGETSLKLRERLAIKAFSTTARYDQTIAAYLNGEQQTCASFRLELPLATRLRYGENPHQHAELYGSFHDYFEKLQGKELSYNNILDISAAAALIEEFSKPTVAILKHTNPCGVASDPDLRAAWEKAFATDRQAPFGGIIIANQPVSFDLAKAIAEIFSEVIIAPDFSPDARATLQKKKNLRLIRQLQPLPKNERDIRSVPGGLLVQDADTLNLGEMEHKVVTSRPPTRDELEAMEFGWKVVKHVKSNAIVFAARDRTLGIGAGQMSRIDSVKFAILKAKEANLPLKNSAVCSDAFFPFPDGLLLAADAGASCAIQPGGSIRDHDVIQAANERKMAMLFTGNRHFRH